MISKENEYPAEKWKKVIDFPDYEVSSTGQIRRITTGKGARAGHILKPIPNPPLGRLYVKLRRDGKTHQLLLHRLILTTFKGPNPENTECCHEDGNPTNNNISNLYWGTRSQNVRDSIRHGTYIGFPHPRGGDHPRSMLTNEQSRQIKELYGPLNISVAKRRKLGWPTQAELARKFNVTVSVIGFLVRGQTYNG